MKRVRMLTDFPVEGLNYRSGQAVEFPNGIAKELMNLGAADGAKDAVAFAIDESGGKCLVHTNEAVRAAQAGVAQAEADLAAAVARVEAETDAAARDVAALDCEAAKQKLDDAKAALKAAQD